MIGKTKNFYICGNTARGFYSFYESTIQNLDKLYILKGSSKTIKSSLISKFGDIFSTKGFNIELLNCCLDENLLDGVIIPNIKIGVIDGTISQIIDNKTAIEYIDINMALDSQKLISSRYKILELNQKASENQQKAYEVFAQALKIHDEWEKIYIDNLNFKELDKITDELACQIFKNNTLQKKSQLKDMFLGAATPKGPVDFIQNLTDNISKRFFIKGRPGSGKSTMLKKLATIGQQKGYDIEFYHCGFDPQSLDMVIFPELSIAIFDSTPPHEHFPSRKSDKIIDIYTRAIATGTDEKYTNQLKDISSRYSNKVKEGTFYLKEFKLLNDQIEKIYISATDFNKIKKIENDILEMILNIIK